jgi:uncharacterized protein
MTPDEVKATLGLVPLPVEGGWWAQTHLDDYSTAIYYFLEAGESSALHRLPHPEIYHWYAGSPLELLVLLPDGSHEVPVLGPDLAAGQRPQLTVPAYAWQGSTPSGAWTLVGTTMAPGYRDSDFELGDRRALLAAHPHLDDRIRELTK